MVNGLPDDFARFRCRSLRLGRAAPRIEPVFRVRIEWMGAPWGARNEAESLQQLAWRLGNTTLRRRCPAVVPALTLAITVQTCGFLIFFSRAVWGIVLLKGLRPLN